MEFYLVQSEFDLKVGPRSLETVTCIVKLPFINANHDWNPKLWEQFVQSTNAKFGDKQRQLTVTLVPRQNQPGVPMDSFKSAIILKGDILTELQQFLYDDNPNEPLKIEFTAEVMRQEFGMCHLIPERDFRNLPIPQQRPAPPPPRVAGSFKANVFSPGFEDGSINQSVYSDKSVSFLAIPPPLGRAPYQDKWTIRISVSAKGFICLDDILPKAGERSRQILTERKMSDFTILSEDGTPIRCHKLFLAKSPVLLNMLEGDYQEAQQNEMTMSDMTTEGVNALLEYFYCDDVRKAMNNCDITLELLKAADMYDLPVLWEAVSAVVIAKPHYWFGVDMALKLYDFVSKCERKESSEMMQKMLQVLALKPVKLSKSTLFMEMFSSGVAREMFTNALKANHP